MDDEGRRPPPDPGGSAETCLIPSQSARNGLWSSKQWVLQMTGLETKSTTWRNDQGPDSSQKIHLEVDVTLWTATLPHIQHFKYATGPLENYSLWWQRCLLSRDAKFCPRFKAWNFAGLEPCPLGGVLFFTGLSVMMFGQQYLSQHQ